MGLPAIDKRARLGYNKTAMATAKRQDELKNHPNVKGQVPPHSEEAEKALLSSLNAQTNTLYQATEKLESVLKGCDAGADMLARARYTRDQVIAAMNEVRAAGDALEGIVGKSYWPMPTYQDLLMSV